MTQPLRQSTRDDSAPMLRHADLRPNTFDPSKLTIDATVSTFANVQRRDARGPFSERLSLAGLDQSRLIGAPVLDGHRQNNGRDVIGVIERVRTEEGSLVATIRLSAADDVQPIVTRIREGTLRGVSVGYRVQKWADSSDSKTGERVRTAVAWSIFEVSAVPVPADPGATFRNEDMPESVIEEIRQPTAIETRSQIRVIARSAGLSHEWADGQIDGNADVTMARAAAFEEMQRRGNVNIRVQQTGQSNDDPAVILQRREEALAARVIGGIPSEAARPYMGDTLRDIARAVLVARNVSTAGMDTDALFRAAMHTTGDFPQLLTGVGTRTLMPAYQAAQSPLKALARQALHTDFRKASKLRLSEIGQLQKVSESGEIKSTSRGESSESYALDTYGSIFALSRKALINDDLGAFRDWGIAAGQAAAQTEAGLLVTLLIQSSGAGPVMGEDNKRLFHADHGNLAASGSGINGISLSAARLAMRNQKSLDGKTLINAVPKVLLVGADLETDAENMLSVIYPATPTDANPFTGRLSLLVDPNLPAGAWYVFADPAVLPVLEYAFLTSAQGPQMSSREGWDVLGMEFRVTLDFGAGAVDFRGAYRNPGE